MKGVESAHQVYACSAVSRNTNQKPLNNFSMKCQKKEGRNMIQWILDAHLSYNAIEEQRKVEWAHTVRGRQNKTIQQRTPTKELENIIKLRNITVLQYENKNFITCIAFALTTYPMMVNTERKMRWSRIEGKQQRKFLQGCLLDNKSSLQGNSSSMCQGGQRTHK